MGKGRRIDKQRKTGGKWNIHVAFTKQELLSLVQGIGLTIIIAFLFYRSALGLVVGIFVIPYWLKLSKDEITAKRRGKLLIEFKEYMMLIVQGLQTGYSLERAVKQSEKELNRLYPEDSVLAEHVHILNQRLSMNVQLEKAFMSFANSIDLEEAISLAEIISFAKRSGGDYGKNIRETALKIEENLAVKQEIETITTEKRLELKVMCVMPMGILAYITITSKSFIAPLYGNILGIVIMSICLIAYGFLVMLGKKIIDIKV